MAIASLGKTEDTDPPHRLSFQTEENRIREGVETILERGSRVVLATVREDVGYESDDVEVALGFAFIEGRCKSLTDGTSARSYRRCACFEIA